MYSPEELESEKWKEVVGYEGVYDVSNLGRVRRVSVYKKLSLNDVSEIRRLRESGITYQRIADRFGVSAPGVRAVFVSRGFSFRTPNRIIKSHHNTSGYLTVGLCKDGIVKVIAVHILVTKAFIGPFEKPLEVNHIDGIRDNPRLTNLEIVTRSENALHGIHILGGKRVGQKGSKNNLAKLTEEQVLEIRRLHASGLNGPRLGERFGVTRDAIYRIVKRQCWKHI